MVKRVLAVDYFRKKLHLDVSLGSEYTSVPDSFEQVLYIFLVSSVITFNINGVFGTLLNIYDGAFL